MATNQTPPHARGVTWLVLLMLLGFLLPATALAQPVDDNAQVSVYIFRDGKPAEGINVEVGDHINRVTGPNGAIEENIRPGLYLFAVSENDITYHTELITLSPREIMQVIVTLGAPGQVPAITQETSHPDGDAPGQGGDSGSAQVAGATEPGTLTGQVVSIEDGRPIAGARIFISGTPLDLRTDEEGRYEVVINAGSYSMSVLSSDFATRTTDDVEVVAHESREQNFELTPAGLELAEFVVVTPYIQGSLASVIGERRDSADVTDVIGAAQISRAGDSDAAGALKRVTGLTVIGGRFVYVRGLGERYSSTLLNGAVVPSPDPTRRVVPLDLFPTDVIKSIAVQKSFSPNLPADFAGGTVEIRTLGRPDEPFLSLGGGLGYNSETTFKDGFRYDGGNRDWLGIDDGTRALPQSLIDALAGGVRLSTASPFNPEGFSPEEIAQFGQDLADVYDVDRKRIGPDTSFGISGGTPFTLFGRDWGFVAALDWGQKWETRQEVQRKFGISNDELFIQIDNQVDRTTREVGLSGFFNLEGELAEGHNLQHTTMILRQTTDETEIAEGFTDSEGTDIRRTELRWIENSLITSQLGGDHSFGLPWEKLSEFNFDWQYTYAEAERDSPKERRYRYDLNPSGQFVYSNKVDNNNIIYGTLDDLSESVGLNLSLPWRPLDKFGVTFRAGHYTLDRDRESRIRRFKFQNPLSTPDGLFERPLLEDIINSANIGVEREQFRLIENTQATDTYTALQELDAYYGTFDIELGDLFRVVAGARREDNLLQVTTFDPFSPTNEPLISEIDTSDTLPSLSVTWFAKENSQVRLGYSETVNRPDFRELSPSPFRDPVRDVDIIGNPNLQPAAIKNYDIRWETYLTPTEQISAAIFYKDFTSPIELVTPPSGSLLLSLSNADSATNYGVEFDIYKELDFATQWVEDWSWLNDMYVSTNLSWIESEVSLGEQNTTQTTDNRPLQGQSPWVINFQVGYDNPDNGLTATLLFNMFGERIVEVGTFGRPDIYEEPFEQLDFVMSYEYSKNTKLKLKLQNLIDPTAEESQGDEISRAFKRGRSASLSVEYDF